MNDIHYVVIQYVSDPIRNEPINIGVLVWNQESMVVRFSPESVDRQLHLAPWLAEDAFSGVDTFFTDQLRATILDPVRIDEETLYQVFFHPFTLSPIRVGYSAIAQQFDPKTLDDIADDIIEEMVAPRELRPGHRDPAVSAVNIANRTLREPIKRGKVTRNFPVQIGARTRRVGFFANSTSNTGLEARSITYRMDALQAERVADEVSNKSMDLLEADPVERMVVLLTYPDIPNATDKTLGATFEPFKLARSIIEAKKDLIIIHRPDEILDAMRLSSA